MKRKTALLLIAAAAFMYSSCKKEPATAPETPTSTTTEVLNEFSANIAQADYNDLNSKIDLLYQSALAFQSAQDDQHLTTCKQAWRDARSAWEQSEGFLFGPVETSNVDPRIDTWPVSFSRLDSVLASSSVFTTTYIDSLEDDLKGFHPIEYLLFGQNGSKTAAQCTTREIDFMCALALNVKSLTTVLANSWNPSVNGNYHALFTTAGNGSTVYATQRAAFEELVNGMAGICEEVANEKIYTPYISQDPSLEESPFSFNSITDFTNNIRSVQNVYLGKYITDGKGLEDIVRSYNLSLDGEIKTKINAALAALQNITVPFGQAITSQPTLIQNAMNAINELKDVLETELMPFIQSHTN